MQFGDIRRIIDKWTIDCKDCQCREFEEDEVDNTHGESIYPYDTCSPDCSTYYAKKIKEDIISLLDKEEVDITPKMPKINYKGPWHKLSMPENPENGDCYSFEVMAAGKNVIYKERYYNNGVWLDLELLEGIKLRHGY